MTPWNGLGSTFSIILALPLFKQSENSPLVLAVDDHPINRDLLARQIKLLGLRVRTAENGREALQIWRNGHFALVITDCHMSKMDGYGLAKSIRKIESEQKLRPVPIIAWTANALDEEVRNCHAAGMNELLVKPASLAQLKAVLVKSLSLALAVRIPSVVYSIQENTVDEHTETHLLNIIGSPGNLAAISNPAVEGSAFGRTLPRQPPNNL